MTEQLKKSMLPANATQLERALENTFVRALDIDVQIRHIWDPHQCPARLLPWLAKCLSVDEFSSTWPEDIQRQVIADSVPVHLKKGTIGAVRDALAALDAVVDVSRWFEHGGAPYTARITAWAGDNLDPDGNTMLTPELQAQLWRVVAATKPRSTRVDFQVGLRHAQEIHLSASGHCHDINHTTSESVTDNQSQVGKMYVSAAAKVHDVGETHMTAQTDKVTSSQVYVAGTGSVTEINKTVMECL